MNYGVQMGSSGMMYSYIPSFIEIGSGILKLMGGSGDTQTHRQHGDPTSLILFFFKK
jgi:hypothetical protein